MRLTGGGITRSVTVRAVRCGRRRRAHLQGELAAHREDRGRAPRRRPPRPALLPAQARRQGRHAPRAPPAEPEGGCCGSRCGARWQSQGSRDQGRRQASKGIRRPAQHRTKPLPELSHGRWPRQEITARLVLEWRRDAASSRPPRRATTLAPGRLRVCGVDEVGMGALCAPVVAAAVLVRPNCHKVPGVRDSKTLSAKQRERVVGQIKQRRPGLGRRRRVRRGDRAAQHLPRLAPGHAPRAARRSTPTTTCWSTGARSSASRTRSGPYTSIVDGDATSYAIACASVIAKVTRDRLMARLACALPGLRLGAQRRATPRATTSPACASSA